jgi:hypothetical protein
VLVTNLLGGGVNLLFSLTLATLEFNERVNGALVDEASFGEGNLFLELGSSENETGN